MAPSNRDLLVSTALDLVAPGKGILAADESSSTIERRFSAVGLASTEERRRSYRDLLFTAPGIGQYLSGVILFEETIAQVAANGTPFVELLDDQGIIPGIKVDKGVTPLARFPHETITEGLDGLHERLEAFAAAGARFTKWRAVFSIGPGRPSPTCIDANTQLLARYAAMCQEVGLVPIVEPEVLMDGDHSIERCAEVTGDVLRRLFHQLATHHVDLEATILKPNMVLSGIGCTIQAAPEEVALATLGILRETVPPAIPGIAFLSGGQGVDEATIHLDAIGQHRSQPWQLSFSFGRALEAPVLASWHGDDSNRAAAQTVLLHRLQMNSAAQQGHYRPEMDQVPG